MASSPMISIVLATRNRATQLRQMLTSLCNQYGDSDWEIVVADNGSTDDTRAVLRYPFPRLRIVCTREHIIGKSRALNKALGVAKGQLLIFTDDDITASPQWVDSYRQASQHYRSVAVFCGPIIPKFPSQAPYWLRAPAYGNLLFGRFDPRLPEGPLPTRMCPFGANFGVRRSAIAGMTFNDARGPGSPDNSPSQDDEFINRLKMRSQQLFYVPSAVVTHNISGDQLDFRRLFERAFQHGRFVLLETHAPFIFKGAVFPNSRRRSCAVDGKDMLRSFEQACVLNYYCGQLYEARKVHNLSYEQDLCGVLEALHITSNRDLLCPSAAQVSNIVV